MTEFIVNINRPDELLNTGSHKESITGSHQEKTGNVEKRQKRRSSTKRETGPVTGNVSSKIYRGPQMRSRRKAQFIEETDCSEWLDGTEMQQQLQTDAAATTPAKTMQARELGSAATQNVNTSHATLLQAADLLRGLAVLAGRERTDTDGDTTDVDSNAPLHTDIDSPIITANDYRTDTEFANIYNYLHDNELTGDDKADKLTFVG